MTTNTGHYLLIGEMFVVCVCGVFSWEVDTRQNGPEVSEMIQSRL